jgi:hypothetical protein
VTDEPLNLYELLMGEVGEVPVPHSFEEVTTAAFLAQDRADRDSRRRSEALVAERQAARQDQADLAAFMGRGRSHADVLADFAAMSDRADAWQAHQAERAAKRAERQREERIGQLEAEVDAGRTRAEQLSRNWSKAIDGWAAERRRSEGAPFRDDADPVVGYRAVRGGQVEVRSSQVNRTRNSGYILGIR